MATNRQWQPDQRAQPAAPVTYRTLCVRTCDGFYFPVSFRAVREALDDDAARCAAGCKGATLFFHPNPGGDMASARDFTGLQYEALPNAFRHLKERVKGCSCRPEPWSAAEAQRHATYARQEREARAATLPDADMAEPDSGERSLALRRRAPPDQPVLTVIAPAPAARRLAPVSEPARPVSRSIVRLRILNRMHAEALPQ